MTSRSREEAERAGREYNKALGLIMEAGELLLAHGAEANRVEDTISRLCRAYGFSRTDVFTITSSIIVTAFLPDGESLTCTRRIRERDTDLGRVEKVNALSRRVCSSEEGGPLPLAQLRRELETIRNGKKASPALGFLMHMMISASLCVFFGGSFLDGAAAAVSGAVLWATLRASAGLKINSLIQTMVCSAVTAAAVLLLVRLGLGMKPDKIMIGNIMLVIPGIQLTSSLRDMINGDMISGLLNMSEAILKAVSVAMGFAVVLMMGGV